MPAARLKQFNLDARRARDLIGLGQIIGGMTKGLVDASDLYRAAVVQSVAALDAYVHGIVLDRATDIIFGRIAPCKGGAKGGLHFSAVQQLLTAPTTTDAELLARGHISQRLALETYQRPDDIASALASVGLPKIWSTAYPSGSESATTTLSIVVRRRNRIVHECDADPREPGSVTPISDVDAIQHVETVEGVVATIDPFC
jgi:hypothetical protein